VAKIDPRRKARHLIQVCGITSPPIDVEIIAKHNGIDIRKVELPDDISGVLKRNNTGNATIFVNRNHTPVRQRFSIAHELGHFFLHQNRGVHVDKKNFLDKRLFFRDKKSEEATYPEEIEANRFAAELLMPTDFIRKEIQNFSGEDLIDTEEDLVETLAKKYRVSVTAMSFKFQNMGFAVSF